MDENIREGGLEIDIVHLLGVLWKNVLVIVLVAAIFGGAVFGYTYMYVTPMYKATVSMYVNNSSISIGSASLSISNTELVTSSNLVATYIAILDSRTTMEMVAEQGELSYSPEALMGMVSTSQIEGTSAFKITVTNSDPHEAEKIANTIAAVLPQRISEIVDGSSARIIDYAVIPSYRSSPSYSKNAVMGALAGALLCCAVIVIADILKTFSDRTVTSADDVRIMFPEYTVLAVIPDMRYVGKKGYYKSYYNTYGKYYGYDSYGENGNGGKKNA